MLPVILKKLEASLSNTNTNTLSNIIDPKAIEPLSNTILTNDIVLEILATLMAHSPNTFIRILYNIIIDNPYAIFLFIVMTVFLFTILLRLIMYIFSRKSSKAKKKHLSRRLFKVFLSSNFIWIGLLLGIVVGVDVLNFPRSIAHFIKGCTLSVLLWIFYIATNRILSVYTKAILIYHTQGTKIKFFKNRNVFIVLSRAVRATWFLIFITILLGLWGVELGPILAGLGIVGVVVGLALQDTLSHIIGGVSLMLDETYSEGDYVILDNTNEGVIFQIGYRSTKLRTFNEEIIVIPNGVLSKMIITNLSQPVKRMRIITYYKTNAIDASPEKVKKLLLQGARNVPSVLRYPEPSSFFLKPEGSLYSFRLNFYTNSPMTMLTNTDLVQQEIVKVFSDNNIRFGIDESTMHIKQRSLEPSTIVEK